MLAYKLDKEIPVEKLMNDINKLLSSERDGLENKILYICVKNICYDNDSHILKLEHKVLS